MKDTKEKKVVKLYETYTIYKAYRSFIEWVKAGEKPPKGQVKSIFLSIFLSIFGVLTTTYWFLHNFKYVDHKIEQPYVLLIISFLTLTPGFFGIFASFMCWRRVKGYDWWIIPNWD